jgi:hypothetical protein
VSSIRWWRLGVIPVAAVCLAAFGGSSAADTSPAGPITPGEYTYQQALALGLPAAADLKSIPGVPICPPADPVAAAVAPGSPEPPADAPVCFSNPADVAQDIFSVPGPSTPSFSDAPLTSPTSHRRLLAPSIPGYRYGGSQNESFIWRGGQNLSEVSNPSICHSGCAAPQHFYSRIGNGTSLGHNVQVGWVEDNHAPNTGDARMVLTVTTTSGSESPLLHPSWTLVDGAQYAFRNEQCGAPGALDVCMEIWNGSAWTILRHFTGVMRCQNSNGSGDCYAHFWDEAFAGDDTSWFNINGVATG